MPYFERLRCLAFPAVLYAIVVSVLGYYVDNDTYYLLALGREISEGGIPYTDPLIMDGDYPVVIQQWLYAWIMWSIYSITGLAGPYAVTIAAGFGILSVFYFLCRMVSDNDETVSRVTTVMFTLAFFKLIIGMSVRPQTISSLILISALFLLEKVARGGTRPQALWLLPVASVVLVNLHASMWPMLGVIVCVYALDAWFSEHIASEHFIPQRRCPWEPFVFALFGIILTGFINPYGLGAMLYSVQANIGVAHLHETIAEMGPLSLSGIRGGLIFFIMFALTAAYARKEVPLRYVLLSAGTAFMALIALRSSQHFFILGFFPIAFLLRGYGLKKEHLFPALMISLFCFLAKTLIEKGDKVLAFLLPVFAAAVLLGGVVLWRRRDMMGIVNGGAAAMLVVLAFCNFTCDKRLYQESFPAFEAIEQDISVPASQVRLYADFNQGAPAEFFGFKPYLDTRPEIFAVYGKEYGRWDEFYALTTGTLYYQDFFDEHDFDYVILNKDDFLSTSMEHATGYEKLYEDDEYVVYKARQEKEKQDF